MKKSWFVLAVVALAVPVGAAMVEGETPTIKEVMGKLHKGSKSQFSVLKTQVEAKTPDWEAIGKTTKDFVILGASLEKNEPPRARKRRGRSWPTSITPTRRPSTTPPPPRT